ncbi:MAG: SAF domain-containing protein [Elusimicrobia bacterium]|nr:SAF domain-containing protein [Elusimicrobiota bacterium]
MKDKIVLFLISALFAAPGFCGAKAVVAAAVNIKAGERLSANMLKSRNVDEGDLQKGAAEYSEANINKFAGLYALVDIPQNSQITVSVLGGGRGSAAAGITSGWRGYFLETDAATAEIVKPNDNIDILVFTRVPKPMVLTLMQKVRVLDVKRQDGKNYLFLSVAPKDAQYLYFMEKKAEKIKILLRSPDDMKTGPVKVLPADGEL